MNKEQNVQHSNLHLKLIIFKYGFASGCFRNNHKFVEGCDAVSVKVMYFFSMFSSGSSCSFSAYQLKTVIIFRFGCVIKWLNSAGNQLICFDFSFKCADLWRCCNAHWHCILARYLSFYDIQRFHSAFRKYYWSCPWPVIWISSFGWERYTWCTDKNLRDCLAFPY